MQDLCSELVSIFVYTLQKLSININVYSCLHDLMKKKKDSYSEGKLNFSLAKRKVLATRYYLYHFVFNTDQTPSEA